MGVADSSKGIGACTDGMCRVHTKPSGLEGYVRACKKHVIGGSESGNVTNKECVLVAANTAMDCSHKVYFPCNRDIHTVVLKGETGNKPLHHTQLLIQVVVWRAKPCCP